MTYWEWRDNCPRDRHCPKHGAVTRFHKCGYRPDGEPEEVFSTLTGKTYNRGKGAWE